MTCSPRGDRGAHGHLWPGQATQVWRGSRILVTSCPCPQHWVMSLSLVSPPSSTPQQEECGTSGSLPGTGQSPGTDSDTTEATVVPAVPANQVPML